MSSSGSDDVSVDVSADGLSADGLSADGLSADGLLPSSPVSTDAQSPGPLPLPRWFAGVALTSAILLVPWIVYLAIELPSHTRAAHYDIAWVGFDIAMFLVLMSTAVAAMRRSTWTEPLAICTATLLVVDAWFDVVTAAHRRDLTEAILSAVLIELPLALMCAWVAHNTERLRRRAYRRLWWQTQRAKNLS